MATVFLLPCFAQAMKPPIADEEPQTVIVEIHYNERVVHQYEREHTFREVTKEEESIIEQTRPIPNIMDEPQPEWNGNLRKYRVTCYLPTGNNCADGTPPYFGAVASNNMNMGKGMTLYRSDLSEIGKFTVHDVGGHPDLVNGTALDIFVPTLEEAWDFLYANAWVEGGSWYVWVMWDEMALD